MSCVPETRKPSATKGAHLHRRTAVHHPDLHGLKDTSSHETREEVTKLTTGVPELHPISVKAPWHMLGIDFIGPISSEAEDGTTTLSLFQLQFFKRCSLRRKFTPTGI
ncbi:hypothetical protein EMCRGX_G009986 [Ephydatia muelleri]